MVSVYDAKYCSLHVRVSNRAAFSMYSEVLSYEIVELEKQYYADKEDAYDMCLFFDMQIREKVIFDLMANHAKK